MYHYKVFCSACSVAYSQGSDAQWEPLGRLVLDSAYEACLWVAVMEACRWDAQGGSGSVVLSLLGGGVFGNPMEWIADAMARALHEVAIKEDVALNVVINSFSTAVQRPIQRVVTHFNGQSEGGGQRGKDRGGWRAGDKRKLEDDGIEASVGHVKA